MRGQKWEFIFITVGASLMLSACGGSGGSVSNSTTSDFTYPRDNNQPIQSQPAVENP